MADNYNPLLTIANGALALIPDTIINDDFVELKKLLELLTLEKSNKSLVDTLLMTILNTAYLYNRVEIIKNVLIYWKKLYSSEDSMKLFIDLFDLSALSDNVLKYIVIKNIFSDLGVTYDNLLMLLINVEHDHNVLLADRIYRVCSPVEFQSLIRFRNVALIDENALMLNYFNNLISTRAQRRPKPDWVRDYREDKSSQTGTRLPTFKELYYLPDKPDLSKYQAQSKEELTALLLRLYKQELVTKNLNQKKIDKLVALMLEHFSQNNKDDLLEEFSPLLYKHIFLYEEKRQDNIVLFRLYGPANNQLNPTIQEMEYGGSRMFLQLANKDDEEVDWFNGSCDTCFMKIRKRWYAIRLPLFGGGWTGCFCSFSCARASINTPSHFDTDGRPDLVNNLMFDQIQVDITDWGIQDRRNNGDIVKLYYDELNS